MTTPTPTKPNKLLPPKDLVIALHLLPSTVTSLDLSDNNLHNTPTSEVVSILQAIPKQITILNLSRINFARHLVNVMNIRKSMSILEFSPEGLTTLSTFMQHIPKTVTSLDLSDNNLNELNNRSNLLLYAFTAIPVGIKSLNLAKNNFGSDTCFNTLLGILNAIPRTVTHINLCNNNLLSEQVFSTDSKLAQFLGALNDSVRTVQIDETTTVNLAEFRQKQSILIHPLATIKYKAERLRQRGEEYAANTAMRLHDQMIALRNGYSCGLMTLEQFKKNSGRVIDRAHTELDMHRGWKSILGNLAYCILGLGIFYAAACLYNRGFFKFKTDSGEKLDEMQKEITAMSQPGVY